VAKEYVSKGEYMEYKLLSDDEKDEIIAAFLKAQERDHYCYSINAERYATMLDDPLLTDMEFRARIEKLVITERAAQRQVEKIVEHSAAQLPTKEKLDAAFARLKVKGMV
jgi:hypothetical protein